MNLIRVSTSILKTCMNLQAGETVLVITLIKGTVRRLPVHRANVKALGLRKIGQSVEHVLTPSIQGMINAVADMVKVEEI